MKSKVNIVIIFLLFLFMNVYSQSDSTFKKYCIETSLSSLAISSTLSQDYQLQALGGSYMSANFGIKKNKSKYHVGAIFQLPGFLGYNTKKAGGLLEYQFFPNRNDKFNFYVSVGVKYIYSTYSATLNWFYPPTSYEGTLNQKFHILNIHAGYGFYYKVLNILQIGPVVEIGGGFFSFYEEKNIPNQPQLSYTSNISLLNNKSFSLGGKLNLMYNLN